jgi:hypothetical protein
MFTTGYQLRPRHVCSMAAMTVAAFAAIIQQPPVSAGTKPATTDALTRPQTADRPYVEDLDAYRVIVSRQVAAHQEHLEHLEHEDHLRHEARLTLEKREAQERAYALKHVRRHIFEVTAQSSAPAPQPNRQAPAPTPQQASGSPQEYALSLVGSAQFGCLDELWDQESGWNAYAENPSSGAYGIPQALPGDKMASAGPDWQTDADTQIRWGVLDYIDPTYGDACGAERHEREFGWY